MKKLLLSGLAASFALMLAMNVTAQMPSAEDMAKRETEQMKTELKLTADQLPKVEAINLKYAKKMSEMFSQGPGGDFAEMQKKMTEIQTQKRAELEKILNADQLKKYDEMTAARMNQQGPPPM
jgi:periplasmic protein CpxP/Spy